VTRLVSRGQQAECCCPHEVDRAICCWGGLDDVSSYGQGGRHDYSLQLHPISYIIAQQQQTNYNNNTTIGLLLLPHYYYNYGQLQQCLACDHVAEYNIWSVEQFASNVNHHQSRVPLVHCAAKIVKEIANKVFTRFSKRPANFQQMYSKYTC